MISVERMIAIAVATGLVAMPVVCRAQVALPRYEGPPILRNDDRTTQTGANTAAAGTHGEADPAAEWAAYMAAINAAGQRVIARMNKDATAEDRYDAYLQMFGAIESAYLTLVQSDPDHPVFVPWVGLHENFTQPNADTRYLMTSVRGEGVYRIAGIIGNVPKQLLAVLGPSDFVNATVTAPLSTVDLASLAHDADGHFELVLSATRPKDYAGEWRPLDPRARLMFLRYDSDDWGKQREPVLAIDRLDAPSRAARRSITELDERMRMIAPYVENTPERWLPHVNSLPINALEFTNYGFATNQKYIEGQFNFGKDEALIVESEMPKTCRYWSWGLSDVLFATLDWVNNQASLDRGQARIDSDGRLRVVIAHSDPGVPNWLDTVGRPHGTIAVRWYECGSNPLPSVRKVPLADIRKYLPADTPVVTPDQRNEILRARRDAAQFRGVW